VSLQKDLFTIMARLKEQNRSFSIATVIAVQGSSSAKIGDKAVYDLNGKRVMGYIGGGCVESRVGKTVIESLTDNQTRMVDVNLDSDNIELGIPCGGIMTVFVEPQKSSPTILIRGMGCVVETVVELAKMLNFRVLIQTPEEEQERYSSADKIIIDPLELDDINERVDFFILATHHRDDHKQTLAALEAKIPYVTVVASRKKAGLLLDYLKNNGVDDQLLGRFHSPAGLDLGSKTAEEIALSIVSDIVRHRNGGTGESMSIG